MKKTVLFFFVIILFGSQICLFSESTMIGDANGDNLVNINDALLVSQFYVGILLSGNIDEICSDVNCSNITDIIDALLIARYYVKLISQFPCNRTPVPSTPEPEPTPTPVISTPAPEPTPTPVNDHITLIQDWAKEQDINLTGYNIKYIESEAVDTILRGYAFYLIYIMQWPVAYGPEDPILGTNSIVAIDGNLGIELISEEAVLEVFFKDHQVPATDDANLTLLMLTWLSLSQEFKNDGFYTFYINPERIIVTLTIGDVVNWTLKGTSEVIGGGEGYINATATIDFLGGLMYVSEEVELIAGIRPICQSSKLLDSDPVVRKMAEQDLLVMGLKAKDYLFTQREKVSPELQKAIDSIWELILKQEEKRQSIFKALGIKKQ